MYTFGWYQLKWWKKWRDFNLNIVRMLYMIWLCYYRTITAILPYYYRNHKYDIDHNLSTKNMHILRFVVVCHGTAMVRPWYGRYTNLVQNAGPRQTDQCRLFWFLWSLPCVRFGPLMTHSGPIRAVTLQRRAE